MLTGVKTAPIPLRVLLVGNHEEDFFLIREILERNRSLLAADLEHARSLEEAKQLMGERPYGLVLFQHDTADTEAVRLVAEFLHTGHSIPFILLTEDSDEKTVAEIIQSGMWNCLAKSRLDGATLVRTIRNTVALHSLQQEQHNAEESLRKLSRAVEQSADTVVITDRQGIVEYVNPAFEALTGYQRSEVCGNTPRILKSGEQGPEVYQEMWKTILAGNVYRGILVNRKKKWRIVLRGGKHLSHSRWRSTDHALHIEWTRSDGAPSPGSATIAGSEDGCNWPARGRSRTRFQQSSHDHYELFRARS